MKKLFLLSAASMLCFAAGAQTLNRGSVVKTGADAAMPREKTVFGGSSITQSRFHSTAKTATTPFYTETFGSGTVANGGVVTMPTGWTATAGTGFSLTWRYTKIASPGSYSVGVLNSSSASDGWMIYDSDSIGNTNPTKTPITGSLISPTINCSTHPTVLLTFQEYFREFQDSCFVDVSNDGGTTWTTFPVVDNNSLTNNSYNPTNPYFVRMNISSVAANKANVKLRFRYSGTYAGGSYNWLLDDVTASELDPVDLGITYSGAFMGLGAAAVLWDYSLFSQYPRQLVDSLTPVTYLSNYGSSAQTNASINAQIFSGTSSVYNKNVTVTNSPVGAKDSIIGWDNVGLYKPTAIGAYTAAFNVSQAGDAYTPNNIDSVRFSITDTVLTVYGPVTSGSYYLHKPASAGELSYGMGDRFDIPDGKSDTLTSVSVSFATGTTTGVNTTVQLFKMTDDGSGNLNWDFVASLNPKVLAAADISTSAGGVYTTYVAGNGTGAGITPFILGGGTFAAIVSTVNAQASSTVLIRAAVPMNNKTNIAGYFGQADSSKNDGKVNFGVDPVSGSQNGIATGLTSVPLLRMNFGRMAPKVVVGPSSVYGLTGVNIGDAFPNPANNTLSIPVEATAGVAIIVTLSNTMGQVLETRNLGTLRAGQKETAVFTTSALASGTYFYTVSANGERSTSRVIVAH